MTYLLNTSERPLPPTRFAVSSPGEIGQRATEGVATSRVEAAFAVKVIGNGTASGHAQRSTAMVAQRRQGPDEPE